MPAASAAIRNPRSPRPEPAQSLFGGMVVDTKVLCDGADAHAARVHGDGLGSDQLVDRDDGGVAYGKIEQETSQGSESLRARPPALSSQESVV